MPSVTILLPQCGDTARKNAHKKQPGKIYQQEANAKRPAAALPCDAISAPNTPVHQTIVIGREIASANPAKNEERKTRPDARAAPARAVL